MKKYLFLSLVISVVLFSCRKEIVKDDEQLNGSELKAEADGMGGVVCLEMVYPITYIMSDRSSVTGNNREELAAALKVWYATHPDATKRQVMQYPVNVKFKGKALTIANEQQMQRVKMACAGDQDADQVKAPCVELVYPVSYIMPDRTTVTVENKENEAITLRTWFRNHPDVVKQRPMLQYPVNITFKGKALTLKSEQEMIRVRTACAGGKDGDTVKKPCFELVFPLTYIMPDLSKVTGKTQEEIDAAFKRWYGANTSDQKPSLQFPVAIRYGKGDSGDVKIVRIKNADELRKAYADCGK